MHHNRPFPGRCHSTQCRQILADLDAWPYARKSASKIAYRRRTIPKSGTTVIDVQAAPPCLGFDKVESCSRQSLFPSWPRADERSIGRSICLEHVVMVLPALRTPALVWRRRCSRITNPRSSQGRDVEYLLGHALLLDLDRGQLSPDCRHRRSQNRPIRVSAASEPNIGSSMPNGMSPSGTSRSPVLANRSMRRLAPMALIDKRSLGRLHRC